MLQVFVDMQSQVERCLKARSINYCRVYSVWVAQTTSLSGSRSDKKFCEAIDKPFMIVVLFQGGSTLVRIAILLGYCAISQRLLVAAQHRLRLCYPLNRTVIY